MDNGILLLMSFIFIILAISNISGSISTIHWYHRQRVSKEDTNKYGKVIGIGMLIIGISFLLTAILQIIFRISNLWYIPLIGIIVGLIITVYGQFKYNKGIF